MPADIVSHTRVRLLQVDADLHTFVVFSVQLLDNLVELVEGSGRLPYWRTARQGHPHVVLHICDGRTVLATLPHIGKSLRDLTHGSLQPGVIRSDDDDGPLFTERLIDDANHSLARRHLGDG